jgi:hypothetical protein
MEHKITGVCVDIPTIIHEAKHGKWISVKDLLPASGEYVLTYSPEHEAGYVVAYYGSSSDMFFYETDGATSSISATHWMPLPAPPK